MGLGGWLRRVFGGSGRRSGAEAPPPSPVLRITQAGRVLIAEIPAKHLSDADRRTIGRELAAAVDRTTGPMAIDFRVARVIPHQLREPLIELSERARRRGVVLAFVVRDRDQRDFFAIIQLDRHHKVVLDPAELAGE